MKIKRYITRLEDLENVDLADLEKAAAKARENIKNLNLQRDFMIDCLSESDFDFFPKIYLEAGQFSQMAAVMLFGFDEKFKAGELIRISVGHSNGMAKIYEDFETSEFYARPVGDWISVE